MMPEATSGSSTSVVNFQTRMVYKTIYYLINLKTTYNLRITHLNQNCLKHFTKPRLVALNLTEKCNVLKNKEVFTKLPLEKFKCQ